MAELLAQHTRKARKQHICTGCRYPIEAGQTYIEKRLTDGGSAYTWRECQDCEAICAGIHEDDWDNIYEGSLREDVTALRAARTSQEATRHDA